MLWFGCFGEVFRKVLGMVLGCWLKNWGKSVGGGGGVRDVRSGVRLCLLPPPPPQKKKEPSITPKQPHGR